MAATGQSEQLLESLFVWLIFALGELLENYLPLQLKSFSRQAWPQHKPGQQIKGKVEGLGGQDHAIVHVIKSGSGITNAPHRLNFKVKPAWINSLAALENHVF
jgi:hypothetical protein